MKLLTCLLVTMLAMSAAAPAETNSAPTKTEPQGELSRSLPQATLHEIEPETEGFQRVCGKIRAFIFRLTEEQRLRHVGTVTCVAGFGGLKKIESPPEPEPAEVVAY